VTDAPRGEPPADPCDALIREQAERIAELEAVVADLRERLEGAERAGSRNRPGSPLDLPDDEEDIEYEPYELEDWVEASAN
jgi:hypothetical protein